MEPRPEGIPGANSRPFRMDPVERVGPLSVHAFRTGYVDPRRPVVLRGLIESWPARRCWSPRGLRERIGGCRVLAIPTRAGRVQPVFDHSLGYVSGRSYVSMTLAAVLDSFDDADPYFLSCSLEELPSETKADYTPLPHVSGASWRRGRLWLGPAGASVPLHCDVADNLYAQLHGRKRFLLFPPEQGHDLYRRLPSAHLPNSSPVSALEPDVDAFPRISRLRGVDCELEPGDVLYLPAHWWHETLASEATVSINFWWARGWRALAGHAAAACRRVAGRPFGR